MKMFMALAKAGSWLTLLFAIHLIIQFLLVLTIVSRERPLRLLLMVYKLIGKAVFSIINLI